MINVEVDDLSSAEVLALVEAHLIEMARVSPPGSVNAIDAALLRAPNVTFFVARIDGQVCGCGALKNLSASAGEVKSMRTRSGFERRGVGQSILDTIVRVGRERGHQALYLETGTGEAFAAAHKFYQRNGFNYVASFGEYAASSFNRFMAKSLQAGSAPL